MKKLDKKTAERRKAKRYKVHLPFFIFWSGEGEKRFKLRTLIKNIGQSGLSFVSGRDFSITVPIELRLSSPYPEKDIQDLYLKGKIVWTRDIDRDVFISGISFVRLSPYHRRCIKRYLSVLTKKQKHV